MARQARDRLGRPLRDGDPAAYPAVPARDAVTAAQAWDEAIAYVADGLPFHAHEVLEQRWRCAPADERAAWQALAQWGAALTHEARGNGAGATVVAQRAAQGLDACLAAGMPEAVAGVVDLAMVRASLARLADPAGPGVDALA